MRLRCGCTNCWMSRTTNQEAVIARINIRPHLTISNKIRETSYLGHITQHKEFEQFQLILGRKTEGKKAQERRKNCGFRT